MKKHNFLRIISLTAALSLSVSLFAGCTKQNENKQDTADTQQTEETGGQDGALSDGVYIAPIEGFTDDFIRGMDISSILSEEASGVKYYDADGNEQDLFKILADNGVNYIRVRVWNDPFDKDGNGYGRDRTQGGRVRHEA